MVIRFKGEVADAEGVHVANMQKNGAYTLVCEYFESADDPPLSIKIDGESSSAGRPTLILLNRWEVRLRVATKPLGLRCFFEIASKLFLHRIYLLFTF